MEFYSNNYSKYIETLKAEKSKKAFQEFAKNSQEVKSEVVSFTENYSNKESTALSSKESLPNKENNKLEFENSASLYSTSKSIGVETFLDADEYSSISTRVEIEDGDREKNEVSSAEISGESSESKTISLKNSEAEKVGNEVAKVSQNESRSGSEISLENEVSKKEGNNVSLKNESAEKAGNAVSEQITDSERNGINLSREDSVVEKNTSNLIYKIIEEKKAKKELIDSITESQKGSGSFKDFSSEPKKIAPYNLAKSFQYFLKDGRKYEASQYESNAKNYSYYPAGDYATMESSAGQTVNDIIGSITNKSNWSSPGNAIVSALKVATSIVDMINLSGPSRNIYVDGTTANNLRWDLKVAEQDKNGNSALFDDKPIKYLKATYSDEENSVYYNTTLKAFKTKKDEETKLKENGKEKEKFAETEDTDEETKPKENGEEKEKFISPDDKGLEDNKVLVSTPFDSKDSTETFISSTSDKTSRPSGENGTKLKENGKDVEKIIEPDDDKETRTNEEKKVSGKIYKDDGESSWYEDVDDLTNAGSDREKAVVLKEDNKEKKNFSYESTASFESDRYFDKYCLGKIYVIPPFSQLAKTNTSTNTDVAFTIPLQNNLQFEQISRAASYNAISFFGRIGDVQQYSKSGSLEAITLTTKYFVDGDKDGDYTMAKLQDIEMKYRSLVLPVEYQTNYLNEETDNSKFYYFTRPPLINVVLGKSANSQETTLPTVKNSGEYSVESGIYKNLFTDIVSTYDEKKEGYTHDIFYKNFVVTNVSIDKNDNDYNYYVTDGGKDYLDKMGFTVTLTVLEIDENYLGSTPSFNNYYNTLAARGSK